MALDEHVDQGAGVRRGCLQPLHLAGEIRLRVVGALRGAPAACDGFARLQLAVWALTRAVLAARVRARLSVVSDLQARQRETHRAERLAQLSVSGSQRLRGGGALGCDA